MQTGGENLLFDCGPGTMRRLLEIGVSIFDISYLFLSHFHPDHSGELASFLFALKYPEPSSQTRPLTIVAGKGIPLLFRTTENSIWRLDRAAARPVYGD
jgi:ribonuclease BN (tRNA processing enzyme)